MSTSRPSAYGPAIHHTIARLRTLAHRAARELDHARSWIAQLDGLKEQDLLTRVRSAPAKHLGPAFVEEALAAAFRALPHHPRHSRAWARAALCALFHRQAPHPGRYALALALRGNAERLLGDLDEAHAYFANARHALRTGLVGDLDILAEVDHLEAGLLLALDRPVHARHRLINAASLWRVLGDPYAEARVFLTLATLHLHLGDSSEAQRSARRALHLATCTAHPPLEAAAENFLAEALLACDRASEARALLESSSLEPALCSDPFERAVRHALLGRLATVDRHHEPVDAEAHLLEARTAFEQLDADVPYELALVWTDLLLLYARQDRRTAILDAFPHALAAFDRTSLPTIAHQLLALLGTIARSAEPFYEAFLQTLRGLIPPAPLKLPGTPLPRP